MMDVDFSSPPATETAETGVFCWETLSVWYPSRIVTTIKVANQTVLLVYNEQTEDLAIVEILKMQSAGFITEDQCEELIYDIVQTVEEIQGFYGRNSETYAFPDYLFLH